MIGETNQSSPEKIPALNFSHEGWLMISYSFSGPWGFEMAEYHYDALGRRMLKNEPNDLPREYTYDGDNVLISSWGGMPTKYVNGPGIDNPLSVKVAGSSNWSYPLADHLGTQGVTDSFGNGSPGFTGRENDPFTSLMYYRARMYDPKLGRFISEDPIGFAGGSINLYGYVSNSPSNLIDPLGLQDGPRNYLRNPFSPSNWVGNAASNTVSDLLGLDSVACWSWTLCKPPRFSASLKWSFPGYETTLP